MRVADPEGSYHGPASRPGPLTAAPQPEVHAAEAAVETRTVEETKGEPAAPVAPVGPDADGFMCPEALKARKEAQKQEHPREGQRRKGIMSRVSVVPRVQPQQLKTHAAISLKAEARPRTAVPLLLSSPSPSVNPCPGAGAGRHDAPARGSSGSSSWRRGRGRGADRRRVGTASGTKRRRPHSAEREVGLLTRNRGQPMKA